jgi:hypothetical protein
MGNQDVQAADPRQPSEQAPSLAELTRQVSELNDRRALLLQIQRPDLYTLACMGELR